MPRPRSFSLSPPHSRPSTFLTDSFIPSRQAPSKQTHKHIPHGARPNRYSPYQPSRLSLCSTPFSSSESASGSDTSLTDEEGTSGSDLCGLKSGNATVQPVDAALPIVARLSHLGLSRPHFSSASSFPIVQAQSKASVRFAHRRTQSLTVPPSYGYIILPQNQPGVPTAATRLSPNAQPHTPLVDIRTLESNHGPSPPPRPETTRRTSFDRMMLVNPAIAAHLRKGGVVTMRTPDGMRRWRIRLPKEDVQTSALGLEGVDGGTVRVGAVSA